MSDYCPNCHERLVVPNRAWHNADQYDHAVSVTTECCGALIRITPVRTFTVEVVSASGDGLFDDWDVPVGEAGLKYYKENLP